MRHLLLAFALLGCEQLPQVRVVCHDPDKGHLSADVDRDDAIETPCGWVLRLGAAKRVEVWQGCFTGEAP